MELINDLSQIAGTLKFGVFSGETRKRIFIAYSIYAGIILSGLVILIIVLCLEQKSNPDNFLSFVITLILVALCFFSTPVIFLILIFKNEKSRKEILMWLEDAVKLKASSKKVGEFNSAVVLTTVKIQVEFDFDGVHHSCESRGKQFGGTKEGYHRIWTQFADKSLEILYSPKYNQVMVLKPSKH